MKSNAKKLPVRTASLTRGVAYQSAALAGATGFAQVIVAVLYIWSARSAGPELFGQFVTAIAIGTASVGFLDFGTNSLWVREIAAGRMTRQLWSQKLTNKIIIAVFLSLVWIIFWTVILPGTSFAVAGAIVFSTILNQSMQVGLRGIARGDLVSFSILFDRSAALIVFLILLMLGTSSVNALWIGLTVGSLVAAFVGWHATPADVRPTLAFSRKTNPWAGARHYGLANMAISAQSFDMAVLTSFGGASSAGVYAAVARWTQPMGLLANAFSSAAAPHIARASNPASAWHHMRKSIWIPMLAILICVGMFLSAPMLVMVLVGEEYKGSTTVLQILALSTIPAIANQLLFVFLQARGHDRPVSFLAITNVIVQLGLVALLSSQVGAVGAALAAAISQLIMFGGLVTITVASNHRRKGPQ